MGYGYTRHDAERQGFTPGVIASLGVAGLPGIGWPTLRQLGSPEAVLELFSSESLSEFTHAVNAVGGKFVPAAAGIESWQALRGTVWKLGLGFVAELVAGEVQCITAASPDFPAHFNDLGTRRPFWLFLRGCRELLDVPSVAVVGTRSPSWAGEFLTQYAIAVVAEFRAPVVSGLAKGIDSVAHEWALRLKLPTISVLGSGLLSPYPARNAGLADRIVAAGGLLVSEYLPRQQPNAEMFVWRNRLQSCIGACVIATEWQRASGTAHTVKFAADLGRPSISTHLTTLPRSQEAGNGEHHFELPREHQRFCETISAALQAVNGAKSPASHPTAADDIDAPSPAPSINLGGAAERDQKRLF